MDDTAVITEKTTGWRGSRAVWLAAAREALIASGVEAVKIQPLASTLGLSRTSFYWFFDGRDALLDALLEDWEQSNTASLIAATEAYAETITEALLTLTGVFLNEAPFSSGLDLAVRGWAHRSDAVAQRVAAADAARLAAIRGMFERFGYDAGEAEVRAHTVYLVQVGYIAAQLHEDMETRLARVPDYMRTFTGRAATEAELARFRAGRGLG
ncbi:TetR/AcrR family transcriptional regulator [Mesobacterium pallidum]|uniref:TetR/AcrR family transcriptional regulator n=1 Tax=Mesobacterium pallidum TaxID=2872037 RepID=UPI001EE1F5E0|nr:helix-turn-helix domain-containing protein [Mesobacterium pallidum]